MTESGMINKKATLEMLFHLVKWSRLADKEGEVYMIGYRDAFEDCYNAVECMPPVETERKTGKWLPDDTDYFNPRFICSVCRTSQKVETVMYKPSWKYCPQCGAKVELE